MALLGPAPARRLVPGPEPELRLRLAIPALALLVATCAGPAREQVGSADAEEFSAAVGARPEDTEPDALAEALGVDEDELEGEATWYGARHQGRTTASGEPFDMHDFTAAHRTLPFGTVVRVTRVDTRQSVVVRINDRGPYGRGRIIDLSRAAAEEIDLIGPGHRPVELQIVALPR